MVETIALDLGSGEHGRGDLCVTKKGERSTCNATPHLDVHLERYGFKHRPDAEVIDGDIEDPEVLLSLSRRIKEGVSVNVLCCHVIEHLKSPYQFLRNIRDLIAPGSLVIVTPNAVTNWQADYNDRGHLYSFTPASLHHLVSNFFTVRHEYLIANDLDILLEAGK